MGLGTKWEHSGTIHTFRLNLGGVILPSWTLCARNIVQWHPMKHCLSQYYSLKLLFKATLSLKIPTLFTILLLFIPVLFIIRMDINSIFLFSKLLPMKVRNRRCMSDAKHRMKHNQSWSWHAIEWCYHEGSWTGWNKSKQQPPRWQCHWLIEEQKLERMYTYDELRERTKLDSKVLSSQSCIMVYMWHSWSNKLIIYNMYFNRATITLYESDWSLYISFWIPYT